MKGHFAHSAEGVVVFDMSQNGKMAFVAEDDAFYTRRIFFRVMSERARSYRVTQVYSTRK